MLGQNMKVLAILQDKESGNMQETYTYHIKLQGQVDEEDVNGTSPLQVIMKQTDSVATLFTLHADQSGLVGLIRHLHHQGFVILSMFRM
jgi:hypothetical protein